MSAFAAAKERVREALLLDQALQAVQGRSPEQATRLRELTSAVDARTAAAESLAAGDQLAPALIILRDAALLAAEAVLLVIENETAAADEEALERVAALALADAPVGFDRTCELLRSRNRLLFDQLPSSEAAHRRLDVERTVAWLRNLVDPRTPAQIKRSRWLRLVSTGVIALVAVVAILGWGITKLVAPKNLALGKQVQLSSRRPNCGTTTPEGLPPSGLVDGSKSGAYDICTNSEVGPWAIVDLGEQYTLNKVKVYGRDDCCWGQYDLPAVLELSTDGHAFVEIARQTQAYTGSKPWTVPIDNKPARYVRLRVDATIPRELVLLELEVFGSR
jgi:hypothetical protein